MAGRRRKNEGHGLVSRRKPASLPKPSKDVLRKYRAVKALFEGATTPGERRSAQASMRRFEARYADIERLASKTSPSERRDRSRASRSKGSPGKWCVIFTRDGREVGRFGPYMRERAALVDAKSLVRLKAQAEEASVETLRGAFGEDIGYRTETEDGVFEGRSAIGAKTVPNFRRWNPKRATLRGTGARFGDLLPKRPRRPTTASPSHVRRTKFVRRLHKKYGAFADAKRGRSRLRSESAVHEARAKARQYEAEWRLRHPDLAAERSWENARRQANDPDFTSYYTSRGLKVPNPRRRRNGLDDVWKKAILDALKGHAQLDVDGIEYTLNRHGAYPPATMLQRLLGELVSEGKLSRGTPYTTPGGRKLSTFRKNPRRRSR